MRHLLLLLLLACCQAAIAQPVAPFQYQDPKALSIDETLKSRLFDRHWSLEARNFFLNDSTFSTASFPSGNGLYLHTGGQIGLTDTLGVWTTVEDRILLFNLNPAYPRDELLAGGYAVYAIDEQRLTLVKCLTSNYQNRIELHFRTEEETAMLSYYSQMKARKNMNTNPGTRPSALTPGEWPFKDPWQELLDSVRVEYFIRGLKPPEGLSELSAPELDQLLKTFLKKN